MLVHNVSRVEAALALLVKRCARKGLTPVAWTWGKAYTERRHVGEYECIGVGCGGCRDVSRCPLTILGETPRYAGWTFLAALEHLDGENITRTVPGETLPPAYRTRGPQCDHCKLARRRNDTYVLRHDDARVIQVGSTCIADFLGSDDAGKIAALASMLAAARGLAEGGCEDDGMGGGGDSGDRTLAEYFPLVAWAVRAVGWVSRTAAREAGREGSATADLTWPIMMDPTGRRMREAKVEITDEDKATAAAAEQWAENLSDAEVDRETGDYLHNIRALARTGLVKDRTAGIAASIITAYQRAVARERERARRAALPQVDAHVGTVGKRETFAVTLDFVTGYETAYGYTTVCKFRTAEGACVVWKATSTDLARGDVGKVYALTGTVKKHDEYKGAKQTIVTRCAIAPAADMAAAAVLAAPKVKGARARKGKGEATASEAAAGDAGGEKEVSGA